MFVGSKRLGVVAARTLHESIGRSLVALTTIDDRADARSAADEFTSLAGDCGVPHFELARPSELSDVVRQVQPDVCVVVGWYRIVNSALLQSVPRGLYGVHGSLLPRYRGSAPLVWAILNGESEAGVSLFRFDDGMDTGAIVAQERFAIGPDDTIADALGRVESLTVSMLRACAAGLVTGERRAVAQDHSRASYCAQRTPADGRLTWSASNVAVHNAVRAQTRPYPGAFSLLEDGRRLTIWRANVFPQAYCGPPGLVAQVAPDHVVVTCGQGAVRLFSVQIEGGDEIAAPAALKYGARLH